MLVLPDAAVVSASLKNEAAIASCSVRMMLFVPYAEVDIIVTIPSSALCTLQAVAFIIGKPGSGLL